MKASEALAKLKQNINIAFYICPKSVKAIEDACADKPAKVKPTTKGIKK